MNYCIAHDRSILQVPRFLWGSRKRCLVVAHFRNLSDHHWDSKSQKKVWTQHILCNGRSTNVRHIHRGFFLRNHQIPARIQVTRKIRELLSMIFKYLTNINSNRSAWPFFPFWIRHGPLLVVATMFIRAVSSLLCTGFTMAWRIVKFKEVISHRFWNIWNFSIFLLPIEKS